MDGSGYVYVADCSNYRVQKFTGDGNYVAEIEEFGAGPGQFYDPHGVATDAVMN